MATPRPGRPVRGSHTGRPLMAILDFLGRRWALRIGWELRAGALPFRELQRRCGIGSPNMLSTRLREGVELGIFEKAPAGAYQLTPSGEHLSEVLMELNSWAHGWARSFAKCEQKKRSARARRS